MGWAEEIDGYCEWLAAAGAGRDTLRLRRHWLRRLAGAHPDTGPWALDAPDLVRFVATPGWAPETRKAARGTLRGFYGWATAQGRASNDPARLLPPVRVPRATPRPAPDCVLAQAMLAARPREQVMLLLAALAGLRRGEIATLRIEDMVGADLYVHGKGGRERRIPAHPTLAAELGRHTAERTAGWVFPGRIDGHLSPGHVGVLLSGLLGDGWSAHKLRHRFATRTYAVDRDLLAVQALLGHSKPETTARYVELPGDALRVAVNSAHLITLPAG